MGKVSHPAYSQDLAPSGFYLFVNMKRKLNGCMFEIGNELLSAIQAILYQVGKSGLIIVSRIR
jgi:hypothetical protein